MKTILAPHQILIAEVDGKPAGFCLAVPDLTHFSEALPEALDWLPFLKCLPVPVNFKGQVS